MKNNYSLIFFFSYWDCATKTRSRFVDRCKELGIKYELVDVETEEGLEIASRYNIKMCPRIVLLSNHKYVATFNGRNSMSKIEAILKG